MSKYKISFTFDEHDSLNDIFVKVLLREVNNLKNIKSLNEGGNDYTFREYE